MQQATSMPPARQERAVIRSLLGRLRGAHRVPVLMYHRVHPEPNVLSVSPGRFEAHMRFLREYCNPISLTQLVQAIADSRPLPLGSVVVTFDDGYRDNFSYAFPILVAYGVPATFFVTSGLIGERQHFWWDRVRLGLKDGDEVARAWPSIAPSLVGRDRNSQIAAVTEALKQVPTREARELIERITHPVAPEEPMTMSWDEVRMMHRAGMEIGSHTVTHPILSRQRPEEAIWEVRQSKRSIERQLGAPISHFAYPNGRPCDYSPRLMRALKAVGYTSACSTVEGTVTSKSSLFALERVGIYQDLSLTRFILKMMGLRRPLGGH